MRGSLPKENVWEAGKLILKGQDCDRLGRKPPTTITSNISKDFPFSTGVREILRGYFTKLRTQLPINSLTTANFFYSAASMTLKGNVRPGPSKAKISVALRAVISHHLRSHHIHSVS